jgi:hypothetical protein
MESKRFLLLELYTYRHAGFSQPGRPPWLVSPLAFGLIGQDLEKEKSLGIIERNIRVSFPRTEQASFLAYTIRL